MIADKANLFDQYVMGQNSLNIIKLMADSYGNTYYNLLECYNRPNSNLNYITYVLNTKYSLLKFTIAIKDTAEMDCMGIITI